MSKLQIPSTEVTINGHEYKINHFQSEKTLTLLARVVKLFAKCIKHVDIEDGKVQISEILQEISEIDVKLLKELVSNCIRDGETLSQQLYFDAAFSHNNLQEFFELIDAVITANWGGFPPIAQSLSTLRSIKITQ